MFVLSLMHGFLQLNFNQMSDVRLRGFVEVSVLPRESQVYGERGGWGGGGELLLEAAMAQLHNAKADPPNGQPAGINLGP